MARGLAVAVVALLVAAAPAQAASGTYTCANLQAGLDQVQNNDVITVDGICTGQFALPSFADPGTTFNTWTLQGVGGDDGFDRNGVAGRALTGNDSHRVVMQNLIFRDGSVTGAGESGGAIELTGQSGLQLFDSLFVNNHANNRGGAVHVAPDLPPDGFNNLGVSMLRNVFGSTTAPAEGNSATIGGAVSVESVGVNDQFSLTENLFANNTAAWDGGAFDFEVVPDGGVNVNLNGNDVIDNTAGGSGGGGHLIVANTALRVDNELYEGNSIETLPGAPQGDHFGGGLYVLGTAALRSCAATSSGPMW